MGDMHMLPRLVQADLASDIEFLAARAAAIGSARANAELAPLDLRVRSYAILSLAASGLAPTQRELADFLRLDASLIVAVVHDLERRGLVERRPDESDRRANLVVATPDGIHTRSAARAAIERAEWHSMRMLQLEERELLRDLLARVAFVPPTEDG